MGSEKVNIITSASGRQDCMQRLLTDLKALEIMLEENLFESDVQRIGAEQELCFVDYQWRPAPVITDVLPEIEDEHFTTEYARFNMEINLDPMLFTGNCFSKMEAELNQYLKVAEQAANMHNAHILLAGIVPSLRRSDVSLENMTPLPRYKSLTDVLGMQRDGEFELRIEGTDQLITTEKHSLFEGSNTSFQVHYQVAPDDFVDAYNWAQLVTGPLMAATTNSPLLLGKRLWRETRIALFQQSIDSRNASERMRERAPRVSFGNDWVRHSVLDIYRDQLSRHKLLLNSTANEDPIAVLKEGGVPKLHALNIFNGTVYKWNRACYGRTDGKPHLRIENRVLPAGPSVIDEIANAAFWVGMMKGMPQEYRNLPEIFDFDRAKSNFLKAAKQGLGAHFVWPGIKGKIAAPDLILKELLPIASTGLQIAGVDQKDVERLMSVIEERVVSGQTGSQWMLDTYHKVKPDHGKESAQVAVTASLFNRQQKGEPVHTWSVGEIDEVGDWRSRYSTIDQLMATDLFTVGEDDLLDFVVNIMDWRNINHLPVENDKGELVGMLEAENILKWCFRAKKKMNGSTMSAKDVMETEFVRVEPNTPMSEAVEQLNDSNVGCLAVVSNNKLVGLVTQHDLAKMSAELLRDW